MGAKAGATFEGCPELDCVPTGRYAVGRSLREVWGNRFKALKNIPSVLSIVWHSGPQVVATAIVLRVVAAVIPLILLAITRRIVDGVVVHLAGHAVLPARFWWFVAAEFGVATLGAVLTRTIDYSDALLAERFTLQISIRIMEHASNLHLAAYEDPVFYDQLERARVQATDRLGMIQAIGRLLQQSITTITLAAGILVYSPLLFLVLIACVIPAFLGESHFAFLGYTLAFSQTPVRRKLDYLRLLGASKESAKELKLFGLRPFLISQFSALSTGLYRQIVALAKKRLIAGSLFSLLGISGYYGAYVWVIYQTIAGHITVGSMTFLIGVIAGTSTNIQLVFSTLSSIADQALFLTDLVRFFAVEPRIRSKPEAIPAPRPIRHGFEFQNVSFAYPGAARLVLKRLNLQVEPGERIALIGENGRGKTTVVKLLTRLYDPTEGRVLLDNVDLREYDVDDLRGRVTVIFQDFMRYDMTAAENIAVSQINQRADHFEIELAARKSLAHGVVAQLPHGYEQILGRRFEGGVDLSGGEWQKIALARAYLRDAELLILDEPTASLDARSEHQVFERFGELTKGKMAVLISHRFSTVRMADRILVLEGGNIAEEGSHHQLLAQGGRYSAMFEMQAACYR